MMKQKINKITKALTLFAASVLIAGANVPTALAAPTATQEFALPTSGAAPSFIAAGADGNLWFSETGTDQVGRITPSGVITEFPLSTPGSAPTSITKGPDGNIWFLETGTDQVGRITPSGVITEFPVPSGGAFRITAGPDGNLWIADANTGNNRIIKMDINGNTTDYALPGGAGSYSIAPGPDGNIWFSTNGGNAEIGRITPSGLITIFPPATVDTLPIELTAGPDGNIWYTHVSANIIGKMTPSGVSTEFAAPSSPTSLAPGPDGNVWFVSSITQQVGYISPTGDITTVPLLTPNTLPYSLVAGPDDNIWFTQYLGNSIGVIGGLDIAPPTPGGGTSPGGNPSVEQISGGATSTEIQAPNTGYGAPSHSPLLYYLAGLIIVSSSAAIVAYSRFRRIYNS